MEKSRQGGLRILFADDESHLRDLMQMELPRLGHEVTVCPDGAAALRALEQGFYDAALLDLRMPGLTGIEVLGQIRQVSPETQVIILTGHATVDTAVQALRLGAFDYLTKPCKWAELEMILNRVAERRDMANKTTALETRLKAAEGMPALDRRHAGHAASSQVDRHDRADRRIGDDPGRNRHGQRAGRAQPAREEPPRRAARSSRSTAVLCPKTWSRASYSAIARAPSLVPMPIARGFSRSPTAARVFLDEVGELDKSVQVKLLRFLESGEIRKVGENEPFRVDVRVLVRDQSRPARDGSQRTVSRRPLFPAQYLRDLPAATEGAQGGYRGARKPPAVAPCCAARADRIGHHGRGNRRLSAHEWPGNIRELANMIERATILAGNGPILPEHLPTQLPIRSKVSASPASSMGGPHFQIPDGTPTLRDIEMKFIQTILEKHHGNKPAASRELGISLKTLYNKINQLQHS